MKYAAPSLGRGSRRRSPPSRGAWIEISVLACAIVVRRVAPLAGGVD